MGDLYFYLDTRNFNAFLRCAKKKLCSTSHKMLLISLFCLFWFIEHKYFFFFFLNQAQKFQRPDLKNIIPQKTPVPFKSHHPKVKQVYNQQTAHIKNRKHSYMFWLFSFNIFRKYQSAAIKYFTIYKCKAV